MDKLLIWLHWAYLHFIWSPAMFVWYAYIRPHKYMHVERGSLEPVIHTDEDGLEEFRRDPDWLNVDAENDYPFFIHRDDYARVKKEYAELGYAIGDPIDE